MSRATTGRALVIGLAETGVSVTRRLAAEGWDVTVIEDAPAASARYRDRVTAVGAVGAALVKSPDPDAAAAIASGVDLVVPSPLVRPEHPAIVAARTAGVPVRSEIDLAADRATVPIVAVTGTNGKTTVTTLTTAMLQSSGMRAVAAGNIGRPLIDAIDDNVDVIVAEVSSFQLAFAETFAPRVAVLLAITPDHLDWHSSFEPYVAAKARIIEHQRDDDLLVYDADDERAREVAAQASARRVGVSIRASVDGMYRVSDDRLIAADGREIASLRDMRRSLLHDRTNALASAAAALDVGATLDGVRDALASYETMPHRVALVGEANGVQWYDDSKATNPDATLRAAASFDSVVLLVGGRNKGLDLSVLASAEPRLRAVVAFGEAAPEIARAFTGHRGIPVVTATSMHEAVRAARGLAQPGDVVLLSPACASFDAYDGYAQRGDDFAAEVRAQLAQEATTG
jgi:UDP-N-acetylmuramoylalanine--D-glutamate ligase